MSPLAWNCPKVCFGNTANLRLLHVGKIQQLIFYLCWCHGPSVCLHIKFWVVGMVTTWLPSAGRLTTQFRGPHLTDHGLSAIVIRSQQRHKAATYRK